MNSFFRNKRVRVILIIAALIGGIMLYGVSRDGYALPTEGFLGTITKPFRSLSNSISSVVDSGLTAVTRSKDYQTENAQLKERIAQLEGQLVDAQKNERDLDELKNFMNIKTEHEDYTLSDPCDIIGYVENDPYHGFYIDHGSDDGLSLYDPVVTDAGLVGYISEISDTYSTVETLCSPNLSIGAIDSNMTESGIVEGDITVAGDYQCKMIYLDKNTTLKEGDLIVTSNTVGLFPQDYLIGSVVSVAPEDSGLSYYAIIEPAVDYENLKQVICITDFAGKEQSDEGK